MAERTALANLAGAVLAVLLSTYAAARQIDRSGAAPRSSALVLAARRLPELRADGQRVLADASGAGVVLERFSRIVSTTSLADPLLYELCENDRVLAFSSRAANYPADAHHFSHKPSASLDHTEALLELAPDLVLVSSLGDYARAERLRQLGLTVFDLGPMRGLSTFIDNLNALGWLVGAPERAERYAAHFLARMRAVAADVPEAERRRALYVSIYGPRLFGGTTGSSYHDVLTHAGLVDVAAARFNGWPSYTPEDLLLLDPQVIVTQVGMRALLCGHPALGRLAACVRGQLVELDEALLNDAGVHMLDAAEVIHHAVYAAAEATAAGGAAP